MIVWFDGIVLILTIIQLCPNFFLLFKTVNFTEDLFNNTKLDQKTQTKRILKNLVNFYFISVMLSNTHGIPPDTWRPPNVTLDTTFVL
jgi:hypothetical protein